MAVSMKDIAHLLGISKMTVSRVIRNEPHVSEAARKKVLSAIKTLDYTPRVVTEPHTLSNHNVSFVFFNPLMDSRSDTEMLMESLSGISEGLNAYNYNLSLFFYDHKFTRKMIFSRLFSKNHPAGFIFASHVPEEAILNFDPKDLIREANIRRIPNVVISNAAEKIEAHRAFKNDFKGSYEAISHLAKLGHRKIGFIMREPRKYIGFRLRLKGYTKALQDYGIGYKKEYVKIVAGKSAVVNCRPAVEGLLKIQPPLTAIFAVNDYLAIEAMEILKDKGLNVPCDVAVVGYDNIQAAKEVIPSLTTVNTHRYLVTRKAAEFLCEIIKNPKKYSSYQEIEIVPSLVIRDSCGGKLKSHSYRKDKVKHNK